MHIKNIPRYIKELPSYVRGVAPAVTVWGDHMRVPFPEFRSICQRGYIDGGEVDVYACLNANITDKDIFFDIGANAGFYSLLANHKGAEVHAFEPFPKAFALLKQNERGNIHSHQLALSDKAGTVYMEEGVRLGLSRVSDTGTVAVEAITLDTFPVIPTIMKVDAEGSDLRIFKGGEQMLRQHKPKIVAEGSPEAIAFLESLGYKATLLGSAHSGNHFFQ